MMPSPSPVYDSTAGDGQAVPSGPLVDIFP